MLAFGQSRYDLVDPMGKMFFNILATFADREQRVDSRFPAQW